MARRRSMDGSYAGLKGRRVAGGAGTSCCVSAMRAAMARRPLRVSRTRRGKPAHSLARSRRPPMSKRARLQRLGIRGRAPQTYEEATYESRYWLVRYPHQQRYALAVHEILAAGARSLLDYGTGDAHLLAVLDAAGSFPSNNDSEAFGSISP